MSLTAANMRPNPDISISEDTIEGAAQIATFLGKSLRKTNYLLERGRLPAFKIGARWHMRRSAYCAFVGRLERQHANAA